MAITTRTTYSGSSPAPRRGFALLVAVIFMSVMLAFSLSLSSLAYKQTVLASSATQSQFAFYAANAGLECALRADGNGLFEHENQNTPTSLLCDGNSAPLIILPDTTTHWVTKASVDLDDSVRCAEITVYKPKAVGSKTYLFSQGYDVSCDVVNEPGNRRFSSRGFQANY